MAALDLVDGKLTIRLRLLERVCALRRTDLKVAAEQVVQAQVTEDPLSLVRGLRWPGTGLPGILAMGTWRWAGGRDFLLVHRAHAPAVVLDLTSHEFTRVVVTTDDHADAELVARELR